MFKKITFYLKIKSCSFIFICLFCTINIILTFAKTFENAFYFVSFYGLKRCYLEETNSLN